MDLLERMARQPGHLARLPKRQVRKLIERADLDKLAADAWRKHCRDQRKRRDADRLARAIASNPKGRL